MRSWLLGEVRAPYVLVFELFVYVVVFVVAVCARCLFGCVVHGSALSGRPIGSPLACCSSAPLGVPSRPGGLPLGVCFLGVVVLGACCGPLLLRLWLFLAGSPSVPAWLAAFRSAVVSCPLAGRSLGPKCPLGALLLCGLV